MELTELLKARQAVEEALDLYMTMMYGPGINQRWVAFSDRLDANSDRRLIAFALGEQTAWELNGMARQAFPMIKRFVKSLQ